MARVSSKYSNTEIVEYYTIIIIEYRFGENTLAEKKMIGAKRKSSANPILLTKEIKNKRKKELKNGEPLVKLRLFPSVSGNEVIKTKRAQWGNPFQNYGCSLQLEEPAVLLFDLSIFR